MTGGKGALPMFVEFMKTFLKDKPKEEFPKAPTMPEDMRELFRQRQRELAAERAELAAQTEKTEDENALPAGTEPKLEQVTMPPPPKTDEDQPKAPKTEISSPKVEATPPPATRPREAEPAKKKGKKGDGEP